MGTALDVDADADPDPADEDRVLKGNGDPHRYQGQACEKRWYHPQSEREAGGIRVEMDIAQANIV